MRLTELAYVVREVRRIRALPIGEMRIELGDLLRWAMSRSEVADSAADVATVKHEGT